MSEHACSCGESSGIRKLRQKPIWLCEDCRKKRFKFKARTFRAERFESLREAEEAYEDQRRNPNCHNPWPKFKVLIDAFSRRDSSLRALAKKWKVTYTSLCVWYNRVRPFLPVELSGRKRNRIRLHRRRVGILHEQFARDLSLEDLRSKLNVLGLPYSFVPLYNRTSLIKYKTGEVCINGYRCKLVSVDRPAKGTPYWRWHFRVNQLRLLDFVILEAKTPRLVHVPIPAVFALEMSRGKRDFRANLRIEEERKDSGYNWGFFVENWEPLKTAKPVVGKKKMMKMGVSNLKPNQRSAVS